MFKTYVFNKNLTTCVFFDNLSKTRKHGVRRPRTSIRCGSLIVQSLVFDPCRCLRRFFGTHFCTDFPKSCFRAMQVPAALVWCLFCSLDFPKSCFRAMEVPVSLFRGLFLGNSWYASRQKSLLAALCKNFIDFWCQNGSHSGS